MVLYESDIFFFLAFVSLNSATLREKLCLSSQQMFLEASSISISLAKLQLLLSFSIFLVVSFLSLLPYQFQFSFYFFSIFSLFLFTLFPKQWFHRGSPPSSVARWSKTNLLVCFSRCTAAQIDFGLLLLRHQSGLQFLFDQLPAQ